MKKRQPLLSILMASMVLVACGGDGSSDSSTSTPSEPKPQPEQSLNTEGRLVIVDDNTDRPNLNLYDLKLEKSIHNIQLKQAVSGLYSSPDYRYAVLMERDQGVVSFYDSGLSLNNGIVAEQTPQLLNYQLFGAKPTHYRSFNGQSAIFYDGDDQQGSKFDVFKDADITKKLVASQKLPLAHHGVAEPRGEMVLSTYLPVGATKLSLVKSYQLHGDHFHEEQTLVNECPSLHGASSIQRYTAFGCEDGVLLVEQQGQKFVDFKLPLNVRIGTVLGNVNAPNLVGIASTTPDLFVIDATQKSVRQLKWSEQPDVQRLKQVYSATGQYFVLLDGSGTLHIFDAKTWQEKSHPQVLKINSVQLAKSQLIAHGQLDEVFLSDPENKEILKIDLATGEVKQRIQLNSVPAQITWLGVNKAK
ncbi:glutaminyl-peptide cyclotransferase [Acinetobacter shaoyimingii]|uniref:Glutaminyl-peptide cyclotransferase n=1 Tax=Acinetobacter shaoyimingii TaxID=2715164 RepID=A0A6G8RYN0_9GAMM|nr:glutaminyl-peptide cyclotransferase [Acinetobacter shaoyimingii]QIO06974.1 glutaminyl-peptide cyclotransferase [Acinetobacter shaoyimingii]